MKLYKFRALDGVVSFGRIKEILETGEFWCPSFWSLNDPMEGVFNDPNDEVCGEALDELLYQKTHTGICSFSGKKGLKNPLIWGYYANGFKGVAIEIEVEKCMGIEKVGYEPTIHTLNDSLGNHEGLKNRILTTKLKCWEHEDEYRYLCESASECSKKIGKITGVYFGDPYRNVQNRPSILESSDYLKCYTCYVEKLKTVVAPALCHDVWLDHEGVVQIPKGVSEN